MKLSLPSSALLSLIFASTAHAATDCYNSTLAILLAQTADPPIKDFIICPDTTITIGLPTDLTFAKFAGGDFPLTAILDGVTIKCGEDGSSANNCALSGGLIQFATTPTSSLFPSTVTTNNLKIQGLTFTGALAGIPGVGAASVGLSAPGMNMVVDDCIFKDVSPADDATTYSVIFLKPNALTAPEDFPSGSASLTISNSVFQDITYRATNVIDMIDQSLTLENLEFKNIAYEDCGCEISSVINVAGGPLTMKDISFDNVEFKTSVVFLGGKNETTFTNNGGITENNLVVSDKANRDAGTYCEEGLVTANGDGELNFTNNLDMCEGLFDVDEPVTEPMDAATMMSTIVGSIVAVALVFMA